MAKGFFGPPVADRLWAKVDRKGPDECWNWLGSPKVGYGHIKKTGQRVSSQTHRVAWGITNGPIPVGLIVCHKCDNPRCCNPNHLFLGTYKENTSDMYQKKRDPLSKGSRYQPNVKGENNGRAKLDQEAVSFIREQRDHVLKCDLATLFGVSKSTIKRVQSGSQWQ